MGSIFNLRYLNLKDVGFGGVIPPHLGNLSKLHHLHIGNAGYSPSNPLYAEDLEWISSLTSLKFLDMTLVNLSKALNWLQVMNKLPSLSVLRLSQCDLYSIGTLPHVNFSSLTTLDLSINYITSSSLDWFADLNSLVTLDLTSGNIQGPFPSFLRNMTSLRFLSLSNNKLTSQIPNWLFHMTTLEYLGLQSNKFEGEIPKHIENVTLIRVLDLSYNVLEGDILGSLANICAFQLSNLSYHRPRKALEILDLRGNVLKGPVPDALGDCKNLKDLDLGMNRFWSNTCLVGKNFILASSVY